MSDYRVLDSDEAEQALVAMYSGTIELMINALSCNNLINNKNKPHYQIVDGQLVFSLAAIYQKIVQADAPSFNQYRRMIFASSLNRDLLSHQLKVISYGIESSTNTPLYCLMPTTLVAGTEHE